MCYTVNTIGEINDWTSGHYQLANRLAFLYFLNRELELDTWLVLVNFVGDTTHVVTEMEEWLSLYNEIFKNITSTYKEARNMERDFTQQVEPFFPVWMGCTSVFV